MVSDLNKTIKPFVRPIIKSILALFSLFVLRLLITILPGLDIAVGPTGLTIAQILNTIIGILMIGLVAWIGVRTRSVGKSTNNSMVRSITGMTLLMIIFISILLTHSVLKPVIRPILTPQPGVWVYDITFLLVSLIPITIIGYRVLSNLNSLTNYVVEYINKIQRFEDLLDIASTNSSQNPPVGGTNHCKNCGSNVPYNGSFCNNCGNKL